MVSDTFGSCRLHLSLVSASAAQTFFLLPCSPDSVRVGSACIDRYEASLWRTSNNVVVAKIRLGTVTLADLTAAGAVQLGLTPGDLNAVGCENSGYGCTGIYAASLRGVIPAGYLSWFQAIAAARNSLKRLPTNIEWQAAALGTPDGYPCITSAGGRGLTGTPGCVSDVGAFDMVGNHWEYVADWVPRATAFADPLFGNDKNLTAGPSAGWGALARGGTWRDGGDNGPFASHAQDSPATQDPDGQFGFRGAR